MIERNFSTFQLHYVLSQIFNFCSAKSKLCFWENCMCFFKNEFWESVIPRKKLMFIFQVVFFTFWLQKICCSQNVFVRFCLIYSTTNIFNCFHSWKWTNAHLKKNRKNMKKYGLFLKNMFFRFFQNHFWTQYICGE